MPNALVLVSQMLGDICCTLSAKDNIRTARPLIKKARGVFSPLSHCTDPISAARIDFCKAELELIANKESAAGVHQARDSLCDLTYEWLERALFSFEQAIEARKAEAGSYKGFVTELAAMALLNRSPFPRTITLPALPLNESSLRRQHNYDLVLVENGDNDQPAVPHCIQVKARCVGMRPQHKSHRDRRSYNSNIFLLSGCCDLGMQRDNDNERRPALRLPKLVLKEALGGISEYSKEYLDVRTAALVEDVTHNRRRGTLSYQETEAA